MTRRRLGFALAATTMAAVAIRRRRARVAHPSPLRVVAVLVSLSLGNWVSDLWDNTAGSVLADVKTWVRHLLDSLTAWIDDAFKWVHRTFDDVTRWISDAFDAVYKWATDAWNGLYGWVKSAFDAVYRWAGEAVGTVQRWAEAAWRDVVGWAEKAIGALGDAVDAVGRWVVDNIWRPLSDAIAYVWHEVVEPAFHWLSGIVGDLWTWAHDAVKWLLRLVGSVWDWVERWATPLLSAVEKAFGWIVFAAEHPFTWWHDLLDDAFRNAPSWLLRHVTAAVEQHGDELERVVSEWLAS